MNIWRRKISKVYFISDTHFGHRKVFTFEDGWRAKVLGGISTIEEHDNTIIDRINSVVNKRDWLYILGDLGYDFKRINDINCFKKIHLGNHDTHKIKDYITIINNVDIISCISYKKHWISHIPIHPLEIRNRLLNIHGHTHSKSVPDARYVNMSVDVTCGFPIPFEYIREGKFVSHNITTPELALDQIKKLGYY